MNFRERGKTGHGRGSNSVEIDPKEASRTRSLDDNKCYSFAIKSHALRRRWRFGEAEKRGRI
jgi:hypothetical protein